MIFQRFKIALLAGAFAVGSLSIAATSHALDKLSDGYPKRPITMIVPYGAGGGSDQLARAMAKSITEVSNVNVQVVNKPGGGGTAAIPDFMLAPSDGYTIMQHLDLAVSSFAKGDIRENPAKDWTPLCMAQVTFSQLYIRTDETRFTDWESFLKYAKENEGKVTIANDSKIGSMEQINMSKLEQALGFKTKLISYDKPAERYASIVGGHVDILFEQPGDVNNFLQNKSIKPILTFYSERPGAFADVPTHKEVGADFDALLRFRGFFVKAGMPEDRLNYLQTACSEAFKTESFQTFNKKKYMDLIDSYLDTKTSTDLINTAAETYKMTFKEIGLVQ